MKKYFTKFEIGLWVSSVLLIITSFFIFDRSNYFNLITFLFNDIYGFVNWKKMQKKQLTK